MHSSQYRGNYEFAESDAEPQLRNIVNQLSSRISNRELIQLLKDAAHLLEDASSAGNLQNSTTLLSELLTSGKYSHHKAKDVYFLRGYIFGQIARLFVPHSPFETEQLKVVFESFVMVFQRLEDPNDPDFGRALKTLKTLSENNFCLLLLDLQPPDVMADVVCTLIKVINEENMGFVKDSVMQAISSIFHELENVPEPLMNSFVHLIVEASASSWISELVNDERVKLHIQSFCVQMLVTEMPKGGRSTTDCCNILSKLSGWCPTILLSIVPHLQDLMNDPDEVKRMKSIEIVAKFLENPKSPLCEDDFQSLLKSFAERCKDSKASSYFIATTEAVPKDPIRFLVVEGLPNILNSSNAQDFFKEFIKMPFDALLDRNDRVRCKALESCFRLITAHSDLPDMENHLEGIFLRLKDKHPSVRIQATEISLRLFQWFCEERRRFSDYGVRQMGNFFEVFGSYPDMQFTFYNHIFRNGFFPKTLDPKYQAQFLYEMYSTFTERQIKGFHTSLEYKFHLQEYISEYVKQVLEGDPDKDKTFVQILNLLPDREKAKIHFQNLFKNNDKRILKLLLSSCGLRTTEQEFQVAKKELVISVEQKSSTADFIRNLCSQASLTYISVELLANLLETALSNRSMSHDLLKKLLKTCGSLVLQLVHPNIECLETENDSNNIEHLLLSLSMGTKRFRLIELSEKEQAASSRIIQQLSQVIKTDYGTPKSAKYIVHTLTHLMTSESCQTIFEETCAFFSKHMESDSFAMDPLSIYAIQTLCAIGNWSSKTLNPHIATLSQFVFMAYLESLVGVPLCLCSISHSVIVLEPQVVLKSIVFKAIVRACTPSHYDLRDANSEGVQQLAERCLGTIASLDLLDPNSVSLARLGGFSENDLSQLTLEQVEKLDYNKGFIRMAAINTVFKLHRYHKTAFDNQLFRDVVFTLQDSLPNVRFTAIQKLIDQTAHFLKVGQLNQCVKYTSCLALAAIDPIKDHQLNAREHLTKMTRFFRHYVRSGILQQSHDVLVQREALPESMLPYLIHLLAHHDDFPDASCLNEEGHETYIMFQHMLLFLLEPLLTVEITTPGENIPIIRNLLQFMKYTHDAENSKVYDNRIYTMCDIGLALLKEICMNAKSDIQSQWEESCPGKLSLPKKLFKVDTQLAGMNMMGSHLPPNLVPISVEIFKRKQRTRQGRKTIGPEAIKTPPPRSKPSKSRTRRNQDRTNNDDSQMTVRVSDTTVRGMAGNATDEQRAKRPKREHKSEIEEGSPKYEGDYVYR